MCHERAHYVLLPTATDSEESVTISGLYYSAELTVALSELCIKKTRGQFLLTDTEEKLKPHPGSD